MIEQKEDFDANSIDKCKDELLNLVKQEIINQVNNIFSYTSENNLKRLDEISNEFTLYQILLEMYVYLTKVNQILKPAVGRSNLLMTGASEYVMGI